MPAGWLTAVLLAPSAWAQTNTNANPPDLATQEKEGCIKNLKLIFEAIQAYQLDHKDLPNWLSDLVPKYLSDVNVMMCPVARRTGRTEEVPLSDPSIASSYLFEFCPVPLGAQATNAPNRTRREWKRRQMGLLGSAVPVVRCRFHPAALNVSFDGRIYESPGMWELAFTNRVSLDALTAAALFADERPRPAGNPRFPPRDAKAKGGLLDLTKFYNTALREWLQGQTNEDLGILPKGLQTFGGVEFDVRGVVQVSGKAAVGRKFPTQVKAIPVRQKCKRLHFLHAVGLATTADEGVQVGSYFIHYTNNPARVEIPVVYGRELRDWHILAQEPAGAKDLVVAWSADRPGGKGPIRLFKSTWVNLAPDAEIESIDFVSAMANPAPFLVAITAE